MMQEYVGKVCPFIGTNRKNVPKEKLLTENFGTCHFREMKLDCKNVFAATRTDVGMCFTFNMLNYNDILSDNIDESLKYPNHGISSQNWTLQNGYKFNDADQFPHRALGAGFKYGLNLVLVGNKTQMKANCIDASRGFKLAMHSPTDVPRFDIRYNRIPFRREVLLGVIPQIIKTSSELVGYKPEIRQCYFNGERKLKYFKIYTESNCELECLSNFTLKNCLCVKYGLPFNNNSKMCDVKSEHCYVEAEEKWFKQSWNQKLIDNNECNCLPSCNSIEYQIDISQGELHYSEYLISKGFQKLDDM